MPNDLSALQAEAFAKLTLMRLDRTNVMLPLVNRDYEGEIKGVGSTVHVRTFGDVAVASYSRGATLSYSNLAPTSEPLTVNDSKYFAFSVDDLDEAQNDLKALEGYAKRAAVKIDQVIDEKCLSKYALAHADNQLTSSGSPYTLSASNAYTLFVDAGKALDTKSAPQTGRWAVVGPNWKSFLLKDTTYFLRATDLADRALRTGSIAGTERTAKNAAGFLGEVAGFDVYMSTAVPGNGTGYFCQFGAGPVISYAGQIRKVQKIVLESTFADAMRGLLLHDATVFSEHAKAYGTWYVDAA